MAGNGIDDDGNGYIDDVSGFDFVNHDSTVFDGSNSDTHGTHVAGIIAAAANNEGIIGVAPHVKILPLKFIQGNYGYTSDAIEAIEYAKSIGVKIINCSWGGSEINPALKDAMENSGILFISASGNNGSDTAKQPIYPAAFGLPNVVSVTAVDNVGNLAPFSNYGNTVDLAAPGVNVLSTLPENNYGMMSGTSMAAPYGTGVAALLFSLNPSISAQEVKEKLKNNITTIPQLVGKVYSGGMLNAYKALTANAQSPWTPPSTTQPSTPSSGESLTTYPFAFKSNIENGRSVVTKFDLLDSASPYNKVQLIVSEVGNKTPIFNGYIDNNQKEIQLGYLAVDSHYSFNVKIVKGDIVESYVGQLKINLKNDPITNVPLAVQPNVSVYKSPIFMPLSVTQTVYGTTTQSVSSSVYSNVYGNSGNNSILSIRYEIEPDNSFSQAMLIYDDDDVYGVIGSTTDEDYYKVMFSNNGNANFWLGGIPYNRDYELKIYDDSYAQIYNSSNSGTSDELISNVLIQANRWYYIKVYGFNGSNDPGTNYHVRVKNYVGASPGDSYELNNSFSQAANRGSNSTTYANIHDSSDIDYYQFSLFTKSNVTINLNSIPTNADYDIKLYNSSQTQLYSSTNSGMSNENISLVLDAGTYYIKVYPYSGYSTSNYRLDISSTAALNPPSVSLNAPSNGTSYTLGQTVNISAIGVNTHHIAAFVKGPNDADYVWIANQTGTQFSYDYTPPITGSYSILVKARNGVDGDDSTTLVTSSSVSINVVGSQSEGSLDWITSNIIAGWAWQPSRPNDAIDVHIYINGQIKAVVKANQYRSDLVTAGKGNGYHGFSYQIDWSGYAPGTYQVVAYAVDGSGNNPSLGGSPKSWTVTPQSEGSLDWITSNIIAGWAWQPSRPNDAIDVHIYINGQIKAVVKANQYRSDLVTAGKGNGYHGFSYQIDWSGYAPGTYQVVAYAVDGSGNNPSLGGSPKSWTVTPQSEGSLDWITSNIIAGWAWQPSRPNDAIDVHIYINGQIKAVVKANQYRSDLVTAGKGNGYHGFSYQIDWSGYAPGTYQVVAYAVDGSGNNPSLGGSPKSWTVQAHTWYKMTIGNKTLYIQKPDSASSNMEARVSDNGSSYAVVYNYTNGEWTSNNTYASIPGSGGGATVTSLDEIQNVNTLGMFDDIIVDVTDKVDQVKAILLNSLGFDEAAMTTADWRMVNLGITTGIIDSTFADPSLWNWLVNNKNIKALVFKVAGITELQAEDDYYYIKSKAYTEYGIMVAARVIEYGSIAAAAAALTQAGVSFVGGLAVLAGSGGTGAPIALAIEVESVGALVASGVCTLVGSAAGVVADKAQAAMNSDESKFAKFAEEDEELQKVDKNYKRTFFAEHPELEFNVVVHHAIEQQVLTKYPGLFTESEIQSYSNLRGIPKEVNSDIHLSKIRKEWNRFYSAIDDGDIALTKENFLNKAAEIDRLFGSSFKPSR